MNIFNKNNETVYSMFEFQTQVNNFRGIDQKEIGDQMKFNKKKYKLNEGSIHT